MSSAIPNLQNNVCCPVQHLSPENVFSIYLRINDVSIYPQNSAYRTFSTLLHYISAGRMGTGG